MGRRNWLYFPALGGIGVTILYRVDNPTNSELWLYEGGQKVLLGTYPVVTHPVSLSTLQTHVAGTRDLSGSGYQFTTVQKDDSDTVRPYRLIAGTFARDATPETLTTIEYSDTAGTKSQSSIGSGDNQSSVSVNSSLPNGGTVSGSKTAIANLSGSATQQHRLPPGDWDFSLSLTATNNGSSIVGSVSAVRYSITGGSSGQVNAGETVNQNTNINGFTSPRTWRRNLPQNLEIEIVGTAGGQNPSSDPTPISVDGSGSYTGSINGFRPMAYLSKNESNRFVGLKYMDAMGAYFVDYYQLDTALNATKTTWDYTTPPAPSTADLNRSMVTHSYDDFIFANNNPLWSLAHGTTFNNTYNIQPNGDVTEFTSTLNAGTNPGLTGLIASDIPEASRILWVAALPNEAQNLDPGGHTVTSYPLK